MEDIRDYLNVALEKAESKVLEVLDKSGESDELTYYVGYLNALRKVYSDLPEEESSDDIEINVIILMQEVKTTLARSTIRTRAMAKKKAHKAAVTKARRKYGCSRQNSKGIN